MIPAAWLLATVALAGTPVTAKPPPQAPPPPPAPTMSDAKKKELFKPYDDAMASGQKAAAADALLPILDDPADAPIQGEAWIKFGDLLVSFDMQYSALIAYTHAIDVDAKTAAPKIGTAMDLADKEGDTSILGPVLAKNVGLDVEKDVRSRMAIMAARHYFQVSEYGTAQGILMMVDKDSPSFARAQALQGVLLNEQGRPKEALAPLLTAQAVASGSADKEFVNVITLNLGRSYFAAGNWGKAIEAYAAVDRGSPDWPEAEFERAWAHFRSDDMNGTMSLLQDHRGPFFADWYFPEAWLLDTYSLFLVCKFPTAGERITQFSDLYGPIKKALDEALPNLTPEDEWTDGYAFVTANGKPKGGTKLPSMMLRPYLTEDRFHAAMTATDKATEELKRLQNVAANPFAARAGQLLADRRATIEKTEGARIIAKATGQRDELAGMLQNVQITRLDIMNYQTQLYEQAANTGKVEYGDRIGQLRKLRKARGTQVWPYDEEYWADEAGYYRYDARSDCPASMAPKADGTQ